MSKSFFVLSTLSAPVTYTGWSKPVGDQVPSAEISVTIAGKAGITDRRTLLTPRGSATPVTADERAMLEANEVFRTHVANGFVSVAENDPGDDDKIAADLNGRDPSAPLVPADFQGDAAKPADASPSPKQPRARR